MFGPCGWRDHPWRHRDGAPAPVDVGHDLLELGGALGEIGVVHEIDEAFSRLHGAVFPGDEICQDLHAWAVEEGESFAQKVPRFLARGGFDEGPAQRDVAGVPPRDVRLKEPPDRGAGAIGAD